jgi:uncharacterized protein (TIGR03083 family)
MLNLPKPILISNLFPEIHAELITLLKSLSAEDWQKPTVCANWNVKEVALHLLGGEIGNLSRRRDGHSASASIRGWDDLVSFINDWNELWVAAASRISPRLLIDQLDFVGPQLCAYFQQLDPLAMGGAVAWAGPQPAPVWLDLAREYTERWHHQQHIRDAVNRPGLKQPEYFAPVLEAFMYALPNAYHLVTAAEDTSVTLTITGRSGGQWSILRSQSAWTLHTGAPSQPTAEVELDEETAWRLFTRGIDPSQALERITIQGDRALGLKVLDMTAIIA